MTLNIPTCYICTHPFTSGKIVGPLKDNYSYHVCQNCSGALLDPYPQPTGYQELYSKESYYENLSKPTNNPLTDWFLNLKLYELPSSYVLKNFKTGAALDVGCGNGEYLSALKQHNWKICGSDISAIAVRKTQDRVGNSEDIILGEFSQVEFPQKFNLISFWHILEHINNPLEYLLKAYNQLELDGSVVGEVPNFSSFTFRLFGQYYSWIMIPEHNIYYTAQSLELILKQAGFKEIKVYCPNRAVLNFANSFKNYLHSFRFPPFSIQLIFLLTLPISIVFTVLSSKLGGGEVLRFRARK